MPTVQLGERSLFYTRSGHGDPVILIQGVGAAGSAWEPQMRGLSSHFDLISLDNRGIGQSSACAHSFSITDLASDVLEVMDHLHLASAHIVGHSMGGLTAQQLAVSQPQRVRSLALLCTFAQGREAVRPTARLVWLGIQTKIGSRRRRRHAMLRMIVSQSLFAHGNLDNLVHEYSKLMGRDLADSPPIITKQMQAMARHNIFAQLPKLAAVPTLVVAGSEDPIARPVYGKRLAAAIPGSTYVEFEALSHALTIEEADKLNQLLNEFWTRGVKKIKT